MHQNKLLLELLCLLCSLTGVPATTIMQGQPDWVTFTSGQEPGGSSSVVCKAVLTAGYSFGHKWISEVSVGISQQIGGRRGFAKGAGEINKQGQDALRSEVALRRSLS